MRSLLAFFLTVLLVVVGSPPTTTAAPTQAQTKHALDNDYGNPNLKLGNPSKATTDPTNTDNYLLLKPQYVLSYNRSRNIANWASWQLNKSWMGDAKRKDQFRPDPDLPKGWYQVVTKDYSGSGFDRGHLVNSEDRTKNDVDNAATFLLTNIIPQSPDNNRGVWEELESYSRKLARDGKELYIIAGGNGIGGEGSNGNVSQLKGKATVPSTLWKVILVLDAPSKGLAGVNSNSRTIAVIMPNKQGRNGKWTDFCATVDDVQKLTGYDFFSNVPPEIQKQIESKKGC